MPARRSFHADTRLRRCLQSAADIADAVSTPLMTLRFMPLSPCHAAAAVIVVTPLPRFALRLIRCLPLRAARHDDFDATRGAAIYAYARMSALMRAMSMLSRYGRCWRYARYFAAHVMRLGVD